MATIHKLTKDGATIFPATITDAVVHPQTGKTLTSMMKDYNVSELFPTEGIDGGNKYNLALAVQVLSTHLSAAQKVGGVKLSFISSVSPYPVEEYYLGKSTWSTTASDWDQRFEVGDVIADPSGSWTPSTAEAYINQQIATVNTSITNESITRQTGDSNLQTQINAEVAVRSAADTALNNRIGELEDNCAYIGSNDGSSLISDFDPQTDTVWNKPQILSAAEKAQVQTNINVYGKDQTYTKQEINGLVDTPHQNYVTVQNFASLPSSGQAEDTIYRVSSYNGSTSQVDVTKYSEYAWDGSDYVFLCVKSQIDEIFDVTVYNNNSKYASLSAAIAAIPQGLQRGGMTIKYVQSSDNKYVQYRLTSEQWSSTESDWQSENVDTEPTPGSHNLVESGGVYIDINDINITLHGESGYIDLTQYSSQQAFPYQGKWIVNTQYLGKIIPCVSGHSYTFSNVEGTHTAQYAFLKNNNVVSGQDIDFAGEGEITSKANVLAGEITNPIIAPSDANYFWIATQNGANNPCEMTSIYHQVNGLIDDVLGLQISVIDMQETINGSGESGYIDLSDYVAGQNYIEAGKWFVNAYYLGKLIPCIGGDKYIISNVDGTLSANYAFTKDNNVVAGEFVNFATGSSKTNILAGETAEVIAPSDAIFLWICTQNGAGNNNQPTSIYHQSQAGGLVQRVQDLDNRVDELTATNIITTVRQFPNNDLPVVSFIFDDIVDNDEQIVSLFDEYGLTCGFAFIASTDKIAMYKDKYLAWQRRGYSILNHSIDGNPINITTCPTINDAYAKVATAKSRLEKAGFVVNGWVSPNSTFPVSNPDYSDVLKNLMAYGYVGSSTNTRLDNPCLLSRLSLQTTLLSDILDTNPNNQSSIAFYVAVNRQLTFYGHAADLGNSYSGEVFNIAKIRSVIERCISLRDTGKLAIFSPDDMCRYFYRS